jgi:hypothetical protein
MTQDAYDKAYKLQQEIKRIEHIVAWIDTIDDNDVEKDDMAYVINLLNKDGVISYLKTHKRTLELEFEKL